jgi:hypothetical protein
VPGNIREAELIARIKHALREDGSHQSLTTGGRMGHNGGPPLEPEPPVYDIVGFCRAHRISRSTLYGLWQQGLGPKFRVGTAVRISREAAQAWRAEREAATDQRFGQRARRLEP